MSEYRYRIRQLEQSLCEKMEVDDMLSHYYQTYCISPGHKSRGEYDENLFETYNQLCPSIKGGVTEDLWAFDQSSKDFHI
jgi:hypothetical protein